jgi:hypothetical protein
MAGLLWLLHILARIIQSFISWHLGLGYIITLRIRVGFTNHITREDDRGNPWRRDFALLGLDGHGGDGSCYRRLGSHVYMTIHYCPMFNHDDIRLPGFPPGDYTDAEAKLPSCVSLLAPYFFAEQIQHSLNPS